MITPVLLLVATPEARILRLVDATVAPGVTAEKPPGSEQAALEEAVDPERVERVLRARRVVLARAGRRQQPKGVAPELNESDPDVLHAAALPSTSVTCSTSHWWPRVSAGSATPERAAST